MQRIVSQLLTVALTAALPSVGVSQVSPAARMVIGENRPVSSPADAWPLVEPQLAVHPSDPGHLLATAMAVNPTSITDSDCVTFASRDAGRTWARRDLRIAGCADPWVAFRHDGVALFTGLSTAADNAMHVARSDDGGQSWLPLVQDLGRAHDHESMAVDRTAGPRAGSVYLVSLGSGRSPGGQAAAAITVTHSTDWRTFRSPTHVVPSNLNFNVLNPGVLSDGTLVVPYKDFQSNITDFRTREGVLERQRAWVVTSSDGGLSFSPPLFVSETCGLGFGTMAVDETTGSTRDRLYFVCNDRALTGVFLHASANGGGKWTPPIRVDGGAIDVAFRRPPAVAVNRNGTVAVTWMERRMGDGEACQHLYVAASVDGGQTFLPSARVSSAPSCPSTPQNGRVASRWPEGGDYNGLAAAPDGTFHAVWADSRDGTFRLWTAPITVTTPDGG